MDGVNYKITAEPVSVEEWQEVIAKTYGPGCAPESLDPQTPPITWHHGTHAEGLKVVFPENAEPRKVAAAITDAILGHPHMLRRESMRPDRHMGPYESDLWKLEMEVGGDHLRILGPTLDEKPGEVRRVLREAFAQTGGA